MEESAGNGADAESAFELDGGERTGAFLGDIEDAQPGALQLRRLRSGAGERRDIAALPAGRDVDDTQGEPSAPGFSGRPVHGVKGLG
ncbi:hypothetical protein GCM10023196_049440 [Actinoallomurus vinaceus]|uniref:Uncharacterized protein n=1 Tax=Actinoallomurus vinaceus TaxID=1080074 RepID=A0ABP8UE91_9ACTN